MSVALEERMRDAIWAADSLFSRGKVSGSAANLSFLHEGDVYITASGSCFGRLSPESFSRLSLDGELISGPKPSKEFPLHQALYRHFPQAQAVLHTHSCYATLWACSPPVPKTIPSPTPYLTMRVGEVIRVPYAPPGSEKLFSLFRRNLGTSRAYLLENHGPIVAAKDIMNAFYDMEELEEAARNAWLLRTRDGIAGCPGE